MEKRYEEKAIEMLSTLISFRSISVKEDSSEHPFGIENKKALDYMLDTARADGFSVYNASNYAGHIEYGAGEEIFGIFGHLDVVEPDYPGEPAWDYDPWTLSKCDGKLIGRGVLDDKGGVVAAYIALLIMKDLGIKPKKKIRLFVGCNEERGFGCIRQYLKEMPKPDSGFVVDSAFPVSNVAKGVYDVDLLVEDEVIETFEAGNKYGKTPSCGRVKLAPTEKGRSLVPDDINEIVGKKFLAASAREGWDSEIKDGYMITRREGDLDVKRLNNNSAYLLFLFLKDHDIPLAEFFGEYFLFDLTFRALGFPRKEPHPIWGYTMNVLSIVDIHDHKGRIGLRIYAADPDEAKNILDKIKAKADEYGYGVRVVTWENNKRVDPESPLVKEAEESYREVTGDRTSSLIDKISGSTYSRFVENVVTFGPRYPDKGYACHIANEFLLEKDFYDLIEIYFRALKKTVG